MIKKIVIWSLFLLLLGIGLVLVCLHGNQQHQVYPEVTHAIMYGDTSSFPTFLQMVDFVKSDVKTPKLIFWHRMTDLPRKDPLFQNTVIVKTTVSLKMQKDLKALQHAILEFMQTYPNAKFTLHLNKDQNALVWAFLTTIPRERIAHIHWYEESFGANSFQIGRIRLPKEQALPILGRKTPPPYFGINYALSLMPFYPSTIHIGLKDFILQKYPEIKKAFSPAQAIEDVDYLKIAAELTEEQKQNLLRLSGITPKDLQPFKEGKPVLLFTLGFFANDKKFNTAQINIMNRLLAGEIVPLDAPENYTWLYKEHPWLTKNTFLKKQIGKKWPFMKPLPKQVPLEVLFLTGYMPDKVFGYSSSLFFALPPDRILFYVQRRGDPYVPLLKQAGILADDKIISLGINHVSE